MPIKTGIGVGEAQVYDISSLENNYFKLLQRQAQETSRFQNELADLIGKVKTDGARDIDKLDIAKGYDEIKDLYRKAASIRNPTERNLVRAQITSGIQSLNEYAARSASEAKSYIDTLGKVSTVGEYMYDTDKLNEFKSRINKPIRELSIFNPLDLPRIPDDSSRDKAFDNIYTELKSKAQYIAPRQIAGGQKQNVAIVEPTLLASNIMERLNSNPEWKNLATVTYMKQNPGKQPEFKDIIANELKIYMDRKGNEYKYEPRDIKKETGGEAPDWFNNPNPVTLNIPYAGGKASVDSQNYIGLSIPNKNFAGSSAIDLTTGSPVKSLKSSNDYQIVGIGNFPTITSGNFKGSLAQPDYESKNPKNITYKPLIHVQQIVKYGDGSKTKDLLIPFDRLPANVKSSKALDKVLRNFRPSSGKSPVNAGSGKEEIPGWNN